MGEVVEWEARRAGVRRGWVSNDIPDGEPLDHGDVVSSERREEVREEHVEGEARRVWILAVSAGAESDCGEHVAEPASKRRRADPAECVSDEG